MKKLGFSAKITLASSLIIATALIILASVNYVIIMNQTQNNLETSLEENAQIASSNIADWLNSKLVAIEAIAEMTNEISPSMDTSKLRLIQNAGDFVDVYVANELGTIVIGNTGASFADDYDPRARPWYIKTKQLNTPTFSAPYIDARSGAVLLSAMAPIHKNGRFSGVAASDLSLDYIVNMLNRFDFSGTGHVYLVSDAGEILVHKNSDLIQKNISDIYTKANLNFKPELVEASTDAGTVLVGFFPIEGLPSLNWYLAVEINKKLAFSSMADLRNLALTLTPSTIIITILLLSLLLSQLTKPLHTLLTAMRDIAQGHGDLTKRLTITSSDEIGKLAEYFNTFVANIHHVMKDFKNHSQEMLSISAQMHSISTQSHNELEKQRYETEQVSCAVAEMSVATGEIAINAQGAAEAAQNADTEGQIVKDVVNEAISSIQGLADNLETAEQVINELEIEVESISTVLEVIKGIADQTNLLALNAAIEAARAGEQGRGFAVVADEVRNLAGKTQESTKEINAKIESLQSGARRAVESIKQSRGTSEISVQKAGDAGESLLRISASVSLISDMNIQIATASEEQRHVTEEIARNIVNISDATEVTSNATEESVQTSEKLSDIGKVIDDEVNQFII